MLGSPTRPDEAPPRPGRGPAPWPRWVTAVALAAVVVALGAVTLRPDGAPTSPPPTDEPLTHPIPTVSNTPTTVAATPTTADPVDAAIDAYHAGHQVRKDAGVGPDPGWPALREAMTGEALANFTTFLETMRQAGRAVRWPGGDSVQASYSGRRGANIVLRVCSVDDGVVYVRATGEVVNDLVGTYLVLAEMTVEDGKWKRLRSTVEREWQGARPSCAG
ncbi:MAG: hypothetical protein ACRD0F_07225 [Acidimicrobiales bacterium]